MSQSQQEAYQVICKGTPQKLYQLFRLLSMLKRAAKTREMKKKKQKSQAVTGINFRNCEKNWSCQTIPN